MNKPITVQLSGPGIPDASQEQKELAALRQHRAVLFEAFADRIRRKAKALVALAGDNPEEGEIDTRIERHRDDPQGLVNLADEIDHRFDETFKQRSRMIATDARGNATDTLESFRTGER